MPLRIALVAFKFPPYRQVGAHRWTRLCKYLAREGVEIDVFTVDWGRENETLDHVSHPNIRIHRVPCPGLHRLWASEFDRSTLGGKVGWFTERVLTRFVRGWPLSAEARGWYLLPRRVARVMHKRDIETLVVTGAPFWAVHHAARVKKLRPHTRLIVDYRDPWTDLNDANRWPRYQQAERAREVHALAAAETIVAVTDGLAKLLREKRPDSDIRVIYNGYDPEDLQTADNRPPGRPILLHAGNLFAGREEPLESLLEVISRHRQEFPDLIFQFYGGFPSHLARKFVDLVDTGTIEIHPRISHDAVAAKIVEALVCLHFNARSAPFALSTKIFEYAHAGRPTLSLNYGGDIERLIADHQLGWSVRADDPEDVIATLRSIQDAWRRGTSTGHRTRVPDRFAYPTLARGWLTTLDSLTATPRTSR